MATRGLLLASLLLLLICYANISNGAILFSSLKRTLIVTASPKPGQVLRAGEDKITVTWGLNQTLPAGIDSDYKTVKLKLCYAPVSQVDRPWRKTEGHLNKDKTCQFKIVEKPYSSSNQSYDWIVQRHVPLATYFIRAYVFNSEGHEVAYGQITNTNKTTNLFDVQPISGRHASLDIASVCFSAFSVVSLFGFFFAEKRKAKKIAQNQSN